MPRELCLLERCPVNLSTAVEQELATTLSSIPWSAANTRDPSPFPPPFAGFALPPRGYFLFCSNHFELPLSELADSRHLWNSGSETCIQGAKNGGPFVHEHGKAPYCSVQVNFPVPWSPVHGPNLPHVHTVNTGATEPCSRLRTACDSGWESSAHCQPKH